MLMMSHHKKDLVGGACSLVFGVGLFLVMGECFDWNIPATEIVAALRTVAGFFVLAVGYVISVVLAAVGLSCLFSSLVGIHRHKANMRAIRTMMKDVEEDLT
jgi:hypothetical protein